MKIGLFFGSYNPIHIGHLIIASTMQQTTDLEEIWFIVSPENPFKKNKSLLHEFDRFDMVQKAIADNFKFKVSDVEFHMPRPSYTIDTLTLLSEKHPEHQFVLIIGGDNLEQFKNWKNYEKILEYYELYVYPRPGADDTEWRNKNHVKIVEAPMMDISATFIRKMVKEKKSIRYFVPEEVEEHILSKGFYL